MALALTIVGFNSTRNRPPRWINNWQDIDVEGRASLKALIPYFNRANCDCCTAFQHQVIRRLDAIYSTFERNADGDVIYPDFYGGMTMRHRWDDRRLIVLVVESKLDYAMAHEVFSHLVVPSSHYFVQYSFAQLLETQRRVEELISQRPDCIYSQSVYSTGIRPTENTVTIWFGDEINPMDRDAMIAGFRQHVYDSPMVELRGMFFFSFFPPRSFPTWIIVAVVFLTAPALYLIGAEIKHRRYG